MALWQLAFRADALLVVLVTFVCGLVAGEKLERSTVDTLMFRIGGMEISCRSWRAACRMAKHEKAALT